MRLSLWLSISCFVLHVLFVRQLGTQLRSAGHGGSPARSHASIQSLNAESPGSNSPFLLEVQRLQQKNAAVGPALGRAAAHYARWLGATTTGICDPPCVHGVCENLFPKPNRCWCHDGWHGDTCDKPICHCQHGGTCVAPEICKCLPSFLGSSCRIPVCKPPCVNGVCIKGLPKANYCQCNTSWTGSTCTQPICTPICKNGGTCAAPNVCDCPNGYASADCSQANCIPSCRNGGTCVAPNSCACPPQYTAKDCSQCVYSCPNCFGFWPLTASSGTSDVSVNKLNTVTSQYPVTLATGPFHDAPDTSYTFGTYPQQQYLHVSDSKLSQLVRKSFTWCFWVKLDADTDGPLLEFYDSGSQTSNSRLWFYPNQMVLYFYPNVDNINYPSSYSVTCPANDGNLWRPIAAVLDFDYTTGSAALNLYCDGVASSTTFILTQAPTLTIDLFFGHKDTPGNTLPDLVGRMACIQIYDSALTSTQIFDKTNGVLYTMCSCETSP